MIKEEFTSLDYNYKLNFKQCTVLYYSDSDFMLLYLINRDVIINVRFKGKLCFYAA